MYTGTETELHKKVKYVPLFLCLMFAGTLTFIYFYLVFIQLEGRSRNGGKILFVFVLQLRLLGGLVASLSNTLRHSLVSSAFPVCTI